MEKIIENATIVYKNGLRKIVDALSITQNGIYIGRIDPKKEKNEKFVNHSFIPKNQIQKIQFFDSTNKLQDIDFKTEDKGGKK